MGIRVLAAMAAIGTAAIAQPAFAQNVTPADPQSVFAAIKVREPAAVLKTIGDDPAITGQITYVKYTLLFWGCAGTDKICKQLEFTTGFGGATNIEPERVKAWNATHPDARIFRRENGNPRISITLFFEKGPMTRAQFLAAYDTWQKTVIEFEKYVYPR